MRSTVSHTAEEVGSPAPMGQAVLMRGFAVILGGWTVLTSAAALLLPGDPTHLWFALVVLSPMVLAPSAFLACYARVPRLRATMLSLDLAAITTVQLGRLAGIAMLSLWAVGAMNPVFALWAGGVDVFVGLTALPVAYLISSRVPPPRRLLRTWHTVGLLDFVVAVPLVLAASPAGPRLLGDGPSTAAMLSFPLSWIPMVGVPIATIAHLIALLQLRAGRTVAVNRLVHPGPPARPIIDARPAP